MEMDSDSLQKETETGMTDTNKDICEVWYMFYCHFHGFRFDEKHL